MAVHSRCMDGIDAFLAHAIVDPTASGAANRPEARAAKALGLQILGLLGERSPVSTWRARKDDGKQVALVVISNSASEAERQRFASVADRLHAAGALPAVVRVHAVSPSRDAFVVDLWTTGCATDLPTLHWPPRRRLEFVRRAMQGLEALHRSGVVHGCLCADNVLLDDDLQPVLAEAGIISVHALSLSKADAPKYAAFAAPEVKSGAEPDVPSDVWSAGRLLELLVGEKELPQVAGIVRRCTATRPQARYASAGELAAALDAVIATLPTGDRISRVGSAPDFVRDRPSLARPNPGRGTSRSARSARPRSVPGIAIAVAMLVSALAGLLLGPPTDAARGLFVCVMGVGVALGAWSLRSARPAPSSVRRPPGKGQPGKGQPGKGQPGKELTRPSGPAADRRRSSDRGHRG